MKKFLFILIVLSLILGAAVIYLNQIVLPTKIKSMIVLGLQEATQKKVHLQTLRLHIFKGLVLKNLSIYDGQKTILNIKESSFSFLILPIFKKKLIIPNLKIKSAYLFLERRSDSTFNIQELFPQGPAAASRQKFSIFVSKINISEAKIHFQDDTLSPAFIKDIEDLGLILYLSLPTSIKFVFSAQIKGSPAIDINAKGEYRIIDKRFVSQVNIKNLSPGEFQDYYRNLGIAIGSGLIEAALDIAIRDNIVETKVSAQGKDLAISKDKISLQLNSQTNVALKYNLLNRQFQYSGIASFTKSDIIGLDFFERITDVSGELQFNNSALFSDKLSANIWAIPIEAQVNIPDFKHPSLNINITSTLELNSLQGLLKDKFKIEIPADIQGKARLALAIETKLPLVGLPQIEGSLDILNARASLRKINALIEDIHGQLEFDLNQLKWMGIDFEYLRLPYKTSGRLTDFRSPAVVFALSSADLNLDSILAINQNLIKLSKFTGSYLNSKFAVEGSIDTAEPSNLNADLDGKLNIDLQDIKKLKPTLEKIRPEGVTDVDFKLSGNLNRPKTCNIIAALTSPSLSIYALKAQECSLNYNQQEGLVEISPIHLSLYDGNIEANAKINLNSKESPFLVNADIQGVKIEKLKLDTVGKDKDLAGTLAAQIKLNGFSGDLSKLNGAGQINISQGRLWQLSLFRGLGALLFVKDFDYIVFHEGSCAFLIQDKYIFSDNLKLKSNITNLDGKVRIGFDGTLEASVDVHILDENVPLAGTFKDITQAIIGQAGRFGAIKISGTLKEPKYKFQLAVVDLIKGLKDTLLENLKDW